MATEDYNSARFRSFNEKLLSLTRLWHLAARESGERVLLAEHTTSTKHIPGSIISYYLFCFIYLGGGKISLCSLVCPETHHVDQCGLELIEVLLPLPPTC